MGPPSAVTSKKPSPPRRASSLPPIASPLAGRSAAARPRTIQTQRLRTTPARQSLVVSVRAKTNRSGPLKASATEARTIEEFPGVDSDDGDSKKVTEAPVQPPAWMLPASALGFLAIALDVNSPLSLQLLESADQAIHVWNLSHTSPEFKEGFADVYMSDSFIAASLLGWLYASYRLVLQGRETRGLLRMLVGMVLYVCGGGFVLHGDPVLVHALKDFFHRSRPSSILHHTYSFPSGHSTAAVFMAGYFLFGLLPLLLPGRGDNIKGSGKQRKQLRSTLMKVWAAAGVTTMSARMLADVHWFSDTMAGACLGVCLTTLGTAIIASMEKVTEPEEVLAAEQAAALEAEPEPQE